MPATFIVFLVIGYLQVTRVSAEPDPSCVDTDPRCGAMAEEGRCLTNEECMTRVCPMSCGKCEKECVDTHPDCLLWAIEGTCNKHPLLMDFMRKSCPRSCGKCGKGCMDLVPDCGVWANMGECQKNASVMHAICEESCRICHNNGNEVETELNLDEYARTERKASGKSITEKLLGGNFTTKSTAKPATSHFCYSEDTCGPECSMWSGICSTGQHQSPIDIQTNSTVPGPTDATIPIEHFGADEFYVQNNGHTVVVDFTMAGNYSGIFPGHGLTPIKYTFAALHFHWGWGDTMGSEHKLNGRSFSMEMHLVHFRADFKDIGDALHSGEKNALAVFGVFLQAESTAESNPYLKPIIKLLPSIDEPDNYWVKGESALDLGPIVKGAEGDTIYNYEGSLTTPGCQEMVNWFVKKDPVPISEEDVAKFREVMDDQEIPIVFNFRASQPLNERVVTVILTK